MSGWLLPAMGHAVVLAILLVRVANCGAILRDLDPGGTIAIPRTGVVLLAAADVVANYWWLVAPIAVVIVVANALALRKAGGIKTVAGWKWTWRVGGVLLLIWVLVEFTMMFTARAMYEKLPTG